MIRYTFIIFLLLVLIVPSAHSTNTDEAKRKALETEIKNLEQEREKLNIKLGKFKNRNEETKEKLKKLKKKKKDIKKYRKRYDERYGKSKVDESLIKIDNSIHWYEKRKKHDEEQINKGTKIIKAKDKIISNKKIAYEKLKQTFYLGKYWVVLECQMQGPKKNRKQLCVYGYWVWNPRIKKYDAKWDHPQVGLIEGRLRIEGEYDKLNNYTKVSIIRYKTTKENDVQIGQYYGKQYSKNEVRGDDNQKKQATWYEWDWHWQTLYIGNNPPNVTSLSGSTRENIETMEIIRNLK